MQGMCIEDGQAQLKHPTLSHSLRTQQATSPTGSVSIDPTTIGVKCQNDGTTRPESPLLQSVLSCPGLSSMPLGPNHLIALNSGLTSLSHFNCGQRQGILPGGVNGGVPLSPHQAGWGQLNLLGTQLGLVDRSLPVMQFPAQVSSLGGQHLRTGGQAVGSVSQSLADSHIPRGQFQQVCWKSRKGGPQNSHLRQGAPVSPFESPLASVNPSSQPPVQQTKRDCWEASKACVASSPASFSKVPDAAFTKGIPKHNSSQPRKDVVNVPLEEPMMGTVGDSKLPTQPVSQYVLASDNCEDGVKHKIHYKTQVPARASSSQGNDKAMARVCEPGTEVGTDDEDSWLDEPLRPMPCQAALDLKPGRRLQIRSKDWTGDVIWARMGR